VETIGQLSYRGITAAFRMHSMITFAINPSRIHSGYHKMVVTGKFSFHHARAGRVTVRAIPHL